MADISFDGSTSQTVAFNATVDRLILNLDAAELASVSQDEDNNTVTFVSVSGAVLTLTGTNIASLRGEDVVVAGFDSDIVLGLGTPGADTTAVNGNVAVGLAENDTFAGTADDDLLFGNEGNDTFTASTGSDRLYGGQGNDGINVTASGEDDQTTLAVGGLGSDTVAVAGSFSIVSGLPVFTGSATAHSGNVSVFGGNEAGDPTDSADVIGVNLAEDGNALIFGNGGADRISVVGAGNATVYGGQGNDTVAATVDTGLIVGGLGEDTITVTTSDEDGSATVYGGNEAGDPTDAADVLTLTAADGSSITAFGNGGADTFALGGITTDAEGAEFTIYGGQGNDIISSTGATTGAAGAIGDGSVIYGGLGIDSINVAVEGEGSSVLVYGGNGLADAGDSADSITVALTSTDETEVNGIPVAGVDQTASIFGNGGADIINLTGAGAASVNGGAGDDTITVGTSTVDATGKYTLTGGAGSDEFDVSNFDFTPAGSGSGATAVAADVEADVPFITDMAFGTDTIDFGATVALTSDQTGSTFAQTSLSSAAEAAFDAAFGGAGVATGVNAAVLFNYQGDSYVAFGGTEAAATGGAADPAEVDGFVKVTGYTGTIGTSSFEQLVS